VLSNETKPIVFTVVISEKGGAERRELFDRAELSLGRVQGNDLMLPKGNVSKRHARLLYRDGRFIVTDLNSTNGTYVNRRRISQATIVREGDRIYIGDFVLWIEVGDDSNGAASEPTGSGPVLSVPSSGRSSGDSQPRSGEAPQVESEESGPSYPKVPGPPRVPSGARMELTSDAQSSGRIPIVEPIRPSIIERVAGMVNERIDQETLAGRRALALIVERVKESVGLATIPEEVDPGLAERIERAITEQAAVTQNAPEFSVYKFGDKLMHAARAEIMDAGPLAGLLEDPAVSEVTVARFEHVVIQREGQLVPLEPPFSSEAALNLAIRRLCRRTGSPISSSEMIVERRFPEGTKLSAVMGAAAPAGALLVLRKPRRVALSLEDLVRRGTISRAIATFIQQCLAARINLLIAGPAGGGVASLLSALCAACADERVVAIQEFEDVSAATRLSIPDSFDDALRVLRLSAAMPSARLLVELSTREISSALVEIIGEGADGVLTSVRAPNLRRALARLPADIVAARSGMSIEAAREWVASSFDIAVEVSKLRDGRQRVLRVSEINGTSDREILTQDIFTFLIERTAAGGSIEGSFNSSGVVPRVADEMRARGIALETSLFTRPPSR
jgi:pilus assembly protein CpaF